VSEKLVWAQTEIIQARHKKKRNPLKLQGEVCVCAGSWGLNYAGLQALPSLPTRLLITVRARAGAGAVRAGGRCLPAPPALARWAAPAPGLGSSSGCQSPSPSCPGETRPGEGVPPLGLRWAGRTGGFPIFPSGKWAHPRGGFPCVLEVSEAQELRSRGAAEPHLAPARSLATGWVLA